MKERGRGQEYLLFMAWGGGSGRETVSLACVGRINGRLATDRIFSMFYMI